MLFLKPKQQTVIEAANDPRISTIVLIGSVGTGKTDVAAHASISIAYSFPRTYWPVFRQNISTAKRSVIPSYLNMLDLMNLEEGLDDRYDRQDGMSSSGTRLTNEFRYLLDMINIILRVGWLRAAAILRRVKGSGSRLGRQADRAAAPPSALTPAPAGASCRWRGRPFGVANAPCSLARSCRIGCTRTIWPSQESCTEPATMHTWALRPRQRLPTR